MEIHERLQSLGLTVKRFAEITGYHQITVRNWGRARSNRGIQNIPAVVELLLDCWERHPEEVPR